MKTSEIRERFLKLSKGDQELAIALTVSEDAAREAAGDTDKLFAVAADDTGDLEQMIECFSLVKTSVERLPHSWAVG